MKRKIALLLVIALTISLAPMTGLANDDREMEGNLYLTGLPIVEEKEEFTILVDDGGLAEDKIMYPILEEQTNVHVNLMLFPYEAAIEKKNLLISSGDYPDVIGGWLLGDTDILKMGCDEGMLVPLNDLIDKYSPKMQEILEMEGVRRTMTTPDGNIYTIPYVIDDPLVGFLPWINQDWLDQLGLPMPTTTDELKDTLIAFRDQIGEVDGQKVIPLTTDPNNRSVGAFAGYFGVNAYSSLTGGFAMVDGELVTNLTSEGYKEAIKWLADLYSEGLIDPEFFTHDLAQWKAKGKAGLYGVSYAYGSGDFVEDTPPGTDKTVRFTAYNPLPVLSSPFSDKPVYRRGTYGVSTYRTQVVITDNAANPAMIIRWFDNVFQFDNSVQIQGGLEGVKLTKVSDTQYQIIDEDTLDEATKKKYEWGNMFTQSLPKYIPHKYKNLPAEGKVRDYEEKEYADALYEPFLDTPLPRAWFTLEDIQDVSMYQTEIRTLVEKKEAEWVSGQANIEDEWETFQQQLEDVGLFELLELRKKAIESMAE